MSSSPIVLYLGPSVLDGAPIVVLASVGSSNVKTGAMVQTWIMRSDVHPSEASATKADSSVCGACPRRHSLGGDCYVQIVHAPRAVWLAWDKAGRPGENWADHGQILRLAQDAGSYGLRLGSYGDPAAVPWHVWQDLIGALQPSKVVGYTHQWRELAIADQIASRPEIVVDPAGEARRISESLVPHYRWLRDHLMASCDSVDEANLARSLGWRFFLALPVAELGSIPQATIQCPATRERNPLHCYQCGICDGAGRGASKASVYLAEHGMRSASKARRAAGLQVIQ